MAVKVCINGQMKKIDTTLYKPVIFLNGSKKVLAKAWTFVNGEKIQLWGDVLEWLDTFEDFDVIGIFCKLLPMLSAEMKVDEKN